MSVLIQNNKVFTLGNMTGTHEKLPPGNYSLQYNDAQGFYFLVEQAPFVMPSKVYGKFDFIDRWIKSYHNNSSKNLGILLSGLKGTGKTVAAQLFAIKMGFPVIFITTDEHGPEFEAFLSNPAFENCIVFIDEFEKVYSNSDHSNSLLTLMDGMYFTRLIFLLTVNDASNINNRLNNRLNRIKYHRIYDKLDENIIIEIIDDMLTVPQLRPSMIEFVDKFDMLTMDVLTSVIKEVNLFQEPAIECAKHLNLVEEPDYYRINVVMNGNVHRCDGQYCNYKKGPIKIEYYNSVEAYPELTAQLPDYSNIIVTEYPYVVKSGFVEIEYSKDIKIQLTRSDFSLAF